MFHRRPTAAPSSLRPNEIADHGLEAFCLRPGRHPARAKSVDHLVFLFDTDIGLCQWKKFGRSIARRILYTDRTRERPPERELRGRRRVDA